MSNQLLEQAPVEPADSYGLTASVVGTIMFGLASLVCLFVEYRGLWLWIALVACGLGLILIPLTAWMRRRGSKKQPECVNGAGSI